MSANNTLDLDEIRGRITATIEPWRNTEGRPPFAIDQTIVMLLLLADKPLSFGEIFGEICESFRYYRYAIYGFFFPPYPQFGATELKDAIIAAVTKLDVPLTYISTIPDCKIPMLGKYTVSLAEGNLFLNDIICKDDTQSKKPFRFFDLPPELRNTIYDMVFGYPKSGLHISSRNKGAKVVLAKELFTNTRSYNEPFDLTRWEDYDRHDTDDEFTFDERIQTKPINEILAPLLTCHQFYNEAMPVFYKINHFYVGGLSDLSLFLRSVHPKRKQHITHISVTLDAIAVSGSLTKILPRQLPKLTGLQRMNIRFREERWLNGGSSYSHSSKKRVPSHKTVMCMPAYPSLNLIRGLKEVNFRGPCPILEDELKDQMCAVKRSKTTQRSQTKKRKAEGDDDEEEQARNLKKMKQSDAGDAA